MDEGLLLKYDDAAGEHSVVLEDDGRVAYAYILHSGRIVGDVWLYNRCPTPDVPEWWEWQRRGQKPPDSAMPFANPREFVSEAEWRPPDSWECVEVCWDTDANGKRRASIYFSGQLHAVLIEGLKPGFCRLARKDGPAAKVLTQEVIDGGE